MNKQIKEKIRKMLANDFNPIIDHFFAEKQVMTDHKGYGCQLAWKLNLATAYSDARIKIYEAVSEFEEAYARLKDINPKSNAVDDKLDQLIDTYIQDYLFKISESGKYTFTQMNSGNDKYTITILLDSSDSSYQALEQVHRAFTNAGYIVRKNVLGNMIEISTNNHKNGDGTTLFEIEQVKEDEPLFKITLGTTYLGSYFGHAFADEITSREDINTLEKALNVAKPFLQKKEDYSDDD